MYHYAHTTLNGTLKIIVYFLKNLRLSVDGYTFNKCCHDDRFLIDDQLERLSTYMYNNRFEILITLYIITHVTIPIKFSFSLKRKLLKTGFYVHRKRYQFCM